MKPQPNKIITTGHDSFALRHTWLKKAHDLGNARILREDATIELGVGKNMVKSVRHYAGLCGIYGDAKSNKCTNTMKIKDIFDDEGYDPYIDYAETIWLIHHKLVTNQQLITYYEFFNSFDESVFNNDRYKQFLQEKISMKDIKKLPAENSIKRDVDCFIANYAIKMKEKPTDSFGALLCELGLIKTTERGVHMRIYQKASNISDVIFLYIMSQFWLSKHEQQKTLSLQAITQDPESPGRVFQMHEEEVYKKMKYLAKDSKIPVSITETAGVVNMVVKEDILNLSEYAVNAVAKIYREL